MSKPYIIFTDDACDLPIDTFEKFNFKTISMNCGFSQTQYNYIPYDYDSAKEFYGKIREGFSASTSPLTPEEYVDIFLPYMDKGLDILFISFASLLSDSYNNLCAAKKILKEKNPDRSLIVVDSKRIGGAMGLMAIKALEQQASGRSLGEVYQWLERYKLSYRILYMIDDIFYILNEADKGMGLTNGLAHLGMLVNVKPIVHLNQTGKIEIYESPIGRKKAMDRLCHVAVKKSYDPENSVAFVCHADCVEDAEILKKKIENKGSFKEVHIVPISPLVGAHMGADILGVAYMGESE